MNKQSELFDCSWNISNLRKICHFSSINYTQHCQNLRRWSKQMAHKYTSNASEGGGNSQRNDPKKNIKKLYNENLSNMKSCSTVRQGNRLIVFTIQRITVSPRIVRNTKHNKKADNVIILSNTIIHTKYKKQEENKWKMGRGVSRLPSETAYERNHWED